MLMDRIAKTVFSYNRKQIKDLLQNPKDIEHISEDIFYSLNLARKAPQQLIHKCGVLALTTTSKY